MFVQLRNGLMLLAGGVGYVLLNLAISDEVAVWVTILTGGALLIAALILLRRRKKRRFYEPFNG